MAFTLKTLQWNIGGGKIRASGAAGYEADGFAHIVDIIAQLQPDIVTLQEAHTGKGRVQAAELAQATGLNHFVNDPHSESHVEAGMQHSLAILSRFPLDDHDFNFLPNPHLSAKGPDGNQWTTFDKGVTRALAQLPNGRDLEVITLHALPLHSFGRNVLDAEFAPLRQRLSELAQPRGKLAVVQGDFNNDAPDLRDYAPALAASMPEIPLPTPTTPSGRYNDHLLYKGLNLITSRIVSEALTDHFPLFAEFDISN